MNPGFRMNKQHLFLLSGIIFSVMIIFLSVFLAMQRTSFFSRAQVSHSALLSQDNSYIFASPISAYADGVSIIRVTVFVLNSQGLGISDQTVELKTSSPVTISQIQPVTDNFGRAIFDVTSVTSGHYTINAEIGGQSLSQKVLVSFQ